MKVILKQDVENLGRKGDTVEVAPGYGRNYLIPRKLALQITPSNLKMIEIERQALKKKIEQERLSFKELIQKLNETSLSFTRKAGEKDVIFGSVSSSDIKEELGNLGFEIDKKKILLDEPIKRLGNYTVPIKVYYDDRAEIKIQVIRDEEPKEEKKEKMEGVKKEEKAEERAAEEEKKAEETEETKEEERKEPREEEKGDAQEEKEEKKAEAEEKTGPQVKATEEPKEEKREETKEEAAEEKREEAKEAKKRKEEKDEEIEAEKNKALEKAGVSNEE